MRAIRGFPRGFVAAALVVAMVVSPVAAEVVRLDAATRVAGAVTLEFPAIVYRPPPPGADRRARHAASVSAAIGVEVSPIEDFVTEGANRLLFRDPRDRDVLLKIYKTDVATPSRIAESVQREIALQGFLRRIGVPIAVVDESPPLLARGVARQRRVVGRSLDALYPDGYRRGTDAAVDRLLDTIDAYDDDVKEAVRRQLGLTFLNAVDCRTKRSVGIDLGRCYANVLIESATGRPILIDW